MTKRKKLFFIASMVLFLNACATVTTINHAQPGSPVFFSGTRLDVHTLRDDKGALKQFNVAAPLYPLLDLPASVLADIFIAPLTGGVAFYETLFE